MPGRIRLRALGSRNYRLYFAGQGASLVGTWTQQVAASWLAFDLTHSAMWLGLVAFAGQAPALVVSPFAGALVDRLDRRRLVLWTQGLSLAQALALAVLVLTGPAAWHLLALSLFLGVVNAVDVPGRQALLAELVGPGEDLANAVALNSSAFNAARLVGPAVAGVLLAWAGPAVCFLANAGSYLAVLAALVALRLPARPPAARSGRLLGEARAGLSYAWGLRPVRSALLLVGMASLAAAACATLLPVLAISVLHGGVTTLALLTAAQGAGALTAAGRLAVQPNLPRLERRVILMPAVFGLGMVALGFCGTIWTAAVLLAVCGHALLLLSASSNTLLQTQVEEGKRGRVMGLYTAVVTGLAPVGGLLAGVAADGVGTPGVLWLAGLVCMAGPLLAGCWSAAPQAANAAIPRVELQRVRLAAAVETGRGEPALALSREHDPGPTQSGL
jgi:MFS family permease